MVEYLIMQTNNKQLTIEAIPRLIVSVLALMLFSNVNAEALRDPTQIPNDLPESVQERFAGPTVNAGPSLQSIMLSSDIKAAIINGKKINLGSHYKEAKLIQLTENTATLKNKNGSRTVLKMHANIVKKNNAVTVKVTRK